MFIETTARTYVLPPKIKETICLFNFSRCQLVLLRFAKKSPTSSPEIDIDVGRPNIDVLNILELQNHNSGTMQRTEMADHLLESLDHKKDRTAA